MRSGITYVCRTRFRTVFAVAAGIGSVVVGGASVGPGLDASPTRVPLRPYRALPRSVVGCML